MYIHELIIKTKISILIAVLWKNYAWPVTYLEKGNL